MAESVAESVAIAESLDGARQLGPRGSRSTLGGDDPGDGPSDRVVAVLGALPAWWTSRARAAGLSGRWLDLNEALDARPPKLGPRGDHPAVLSTAATAAEVGAAYAAALAPEVRARHGRHYTPPELAERVWAMGRARLGHGRQPRRVEGLVRDPACGAGALLLPALREHLRAVIRSDPSLVLAGLPNLIEGIDTDPIAVWVANVVLAAEALPLLAQVPDHRRRPVPAVARVADGLARSERRPRAVVMNPPYGRVKLSPDERERFADVLHGHANLYGLFIGAALEELDQDGVVVALVPTSFTSGLYFSRLREQLGKVAPIREISFLADRARTFDGVLQETCVVVFTRSRVRRLDVHAIDTDLTFVATVDSPRGDRPWLLPRRSDHAHVAAAANAMPLTLRDAGWRVSTGPLVWNRRRDDLGPSPGSDRLPVIWAADLDGGQLHRDPARDQHRYLSLRDEEDERVMALSDPALLLQRTTAPEQTRRLVLVELRRTFLATWGGRVVVENHVNVIRPRNVETPLISRRTLRAVLETPTFDLVMRCLSGSVAISAYELESLPLPSAAVLAEWKALSGPALARAVAAAYRP